MIDPFCIAIIIGMLLWGIGDYVMSDPYIGHRPEWKTSQNVTSNNLKTWENDIFGEEE